jgi:hypothetical protein
MVEGDYRRAGVGVQPREGGGEVRNLSSGRSGGRRCGGDARHGWGHTWLHGHGGGGGRGGARTEPLDRFDRLTADRLGALSPSKRPGLPGVLMVEGRPRYRPLGRAGAASKSSGGTGRPRRITVGFLSRQMPWWTGQVLPHRLQSMDRRQQDWRQLALVRRLRREPRLKAPGFQHDHGVKRSEKPAAEARAACRWSKVRKRLQCRTRAAATCNRSSVRTPSRGVCVMESFSASCHRA